MTAPNRVFVESYRGTYQQAHAAFREAAARHGAAGYQPTSQNWVSQGPRWGCFSCALIIILLVSVVGILLLPFVFWGQNKGVLTVTYTYTGVGSGR
ncbi:MAG: hypothetical protein PVG27_02070 [Chloroflexota bacterium]